MATSKSNSTEIGINESKEIGPRSSQLFVSHFQFLFDEVPAVLDRFRISYVPK